MRVEIILDLDVSSMNEDHIHDYVADLTYDMRTSRLLTGWNIHYNPLEGMP